ncbi:unnamed protein product, partial [Linum tenue]
QRSRRRPSGEEEPPRSGPHSGEHVPRKTSPRNPAEFPSHRPAAPQSPALQLPAGGGEGVRVQDRVPGSEPEGHGGVDVAFLQQALKSGPGYEQFPLEGDVESFCSGVLPFGPFYEHVVGYWEESRRRPQDVLFLKYEELCREPKEQVRKLASFLEKPFSLDGDEEVEKVLWRSSLDRLKELEVNKSGVGELNHVLNSTFFRRGTVRDWENYLTP